MNVKKRRRITIIGFSLLLALTSACGSDGDKSNASGDCLEPDQVNQAMDNEDYMNQIAWMTADKKYWPDLGFCEDARVVATSDYMAGLVGGDVWVAQGESSDIWPATAEGSVDLTIIGVEKDSEAWFLGVRKGVDPDNLKGKKISGGPPGDRNIQVGRNILKDMGTNPDDLNWVSVNGGSDQRLQVLIAGQLDAAVLQPRHIAQLEKAGGEMIYEEYGDVPQETWVVQTKTLKENKDAVCAWVEGRIAAKQWLSEGDDFRTNVDEAVKLGKEYGREPSEGELEEWDNEMEFNWSLDGGSPAATFEQWTDDMIALDAIPAAYNWRDHVDFTCLWQAQEKLGLEQNPVQSEVEAG